MALLGSDSRETPRIEGRETRNNTKERTTVGVELQMEKDGCQFLKFRGPENTFFFFF